MHGKLDIQFFHEAKTVKTTERIMGGMKKLTINKEKLSTDWILFRKETVREI